MIKVACWVMLNRRQAKYKLGVGAALAANVFIGKAFAAKAAPTKSIWFYRVYNDAVVAHQGPVRKKNDLHTL
jgi:hypothetical protein